MTEKDRRRQAEACSDPATAGSLSPPAHSAASNFRRYGLRAWLWSLYYRWKWRDES